MLSRLRYWLRAIVRRSAAEREMRDEMQLHLDRHTDLLVARGMSLADARVAARRAFGNVGVHQEDARDARGVRWFDSTVADIRFAFRAEGDSALTPQRVGQADLAAREHLGTRFVGTEWQRPLGTITNDDDA